VDNSNNETGFNIQQSTDGVNFTQVASVGAGVTSYSSTGLSPSTTYYYRVQAYNSVGTSGYSNTASATTTAQVTVPTAPSNLTATVTAKNKITLKWQDNSNNESGFQIEQSTNGVNFTQIATVGPNVTSYSDSGVRKNTLYYYRVRAYNSAGSSAYSNVASAHT
jgi:titin